MAVVPTTTEQAQSLISEQESQLGQTIPVQPKAFLRVFSVVVGGALVLLRRYADRLFANMFMSSASAEPTTINGTTMVPVTELGRMYGAGDRRGATKARLTVTVTVTAGGASVAAGTALKGKTNGYIYLVQTTTTLATPTTTLTVQAEGDGVSGDGAGNGGNLAVGALLEWQGGVPTGAGRSVTVASVVSEGEDAETLAAYRLRGLSLAAAPKRGGALADYRDWATGVPHISRAWVYRGNLNVVQVYVEADNQTNGTPTAAQLTAVAQSVAYEENAGILSATRAPVNDLPVVYASPFVTIDVRVGSLTGVASPATTKGKIETALREHLAGREPYVVGLSVPPRLDFITNTSMLGVAQQVAALEGGSVGNVSLQVGGATVIEYSLGRGERSVLGTVTWET